MFAIQLALSPRTRTLGQGRLKALFNEAFADPFDCSGANVECLRHRLIGQTRVGLEQQMGTGQSAGRDFAALGESEQLRSLVVRQSDDILFGHGPLLFLPQYTGGEPPHQNRCGDPLGLEDGALPGLK